MRSKAKSAVTLMRYNSPRAAPASCSSPLTCRLRSSRGVVGREDCATSNIGTSSNRMSSVARESAATDARSSVSDPRPSKIRPSETRITDFGPSSAPRLFKHRAHAVHRVLGAMPDFVHQLGGVLFDFALAPLGFRRGNQLAALAQDHLEGQLRIGPHIDRHRLGDRQVEARSQRAGLADDAQQRLADAIVVGREVDELAGPGHGDHRHAILGRQGVDELLRAVHHRARRAGADVALVHENHDQAAARLALGVGGGEGFVGDHHFVRRADRAQRVGRTHVLG